MARSTDEQFLHDWVIRKIREKYGRLYSEVRINPGDEKTHEYKGKYPDAILVNYGQVVQIVEVETAETIEPGRISKWKELSELGVKLTLLVPKEQQNAARDLCWKNGLAAKVNLGSFEVNLNI
ncbi:MAG: hypothetical protein KJ002_00630 [Candidatus Dadabacteria bacterium]|jgi:hypothetical protein|nr:hypothetical protein [Candidatus Dadabacteria bacterium]